MIKLNYESPILDTPALNIFDLRPREGYKLDPHKLIGNVDILCLGGCDVAGMRPIETGAFFWSDYFPQPVDRLSKNISFDALNTHILEYITKFGCPKKIYHVLHVPAKTILIDDKLYRINQYSAKAIYFLLHKNFIDEQESKILLEIVNDFKQMNKEKILEWYNKNFLQLKELINMFKFEYYWLTMADKDENIFFKPIIDDLLLVSAGKYVGWVDNIDVLPDTSMGAKTQKKISDLFLVGSSL